MSSPTKIQAKQTKKDRRLIQKNVRRPKINKQEVIKIFRIMEKQAAETAAAGTGDSQQPPPNKDLQNEFFNTGRVGRRNALHDILGAHCTTSTADLPSKLGMLTTEDKPIDPGAGTSQQSLSKTTDDKS